MDGKVNSDTNQKLRPPTPSSHESPQGVCDSIMPHLHARCATLARVVEAYLQDLPTPTRPIPVIITFDGGGFRGIKYIGGIAMLRGLIRRKIIVVKHVSASSIGVAAGLCLLQNIETAGMLQLLVMAGQKHVNHATAIMRTWMDTNLDPDIVTQLQERLTIKFHAISLTPPFLRAIHQSQFANKADLIDSIVASGSIPGLTRPVRSCWSTTKQRFVVDGWSISSAMTNRLRKQHGPDTRVLTLDTNDTNGDRFALKTQVFDRAFIDGILQVLEQTRGFLPLPANL